MRLVSGSSPAVQGSCEAVAISHRITPDQLAWINDDEANDATTYPGASWDADRYEPTQEAIAEADGFGHGYALDYSSVPPADMESTLARRWMVAKLEGLIQRRTEDMERDAFEAERLAWAFAGPARSDDEIVRAIGAVEARRGVDL